MPGVRGGNKDQVNSEVNSKINSKINRPTSAKDGQIWGTSARAEAVERATLARILEQSPTRPWTNSMPSKS
jgi:hypothetical protein